MFFFVKASVHIIIDFKIAPFFGGFFRQKWKWGCEGLKYSAFNVLFFCLTTWLAEETSSGTTFSRQKHNKTESCELKVVKVVGKLSVSKSTESGTFRKDLYTARAILKTIPHSIVFIQVEFKMASNMIKVYCSYRF